ncbi:MAG TPA: FAD-binding protein [Acetobacteraceae bacterium]|jgi:glycolate oxidase FAD binding subunit|nr:FAD-binding protein [Acetobacteraceae bacterium]
MSAVLAAARPNEEAPADEAALVALIAETAEPLMIVGNNTKALLLRPAEASRRVSTRALDGITLYAPKELILSARAGTPLAAVEAAVAQQGQHLIAEPPDLGALLGTEGPQTLGGVVAANQSGPRRVAWGAMRDHVMGVRAVNGRGEVIRSGGRVLKNVTGLDLCKLLTGSYGTLAVMTEITLKTLPAPERRATVAVGGLDPAAAVRALAAALGSPYGVSAAAYLPLAASAKVPALAWLGKAVAVARIEDFATSTSYRAGRLREELRAFGAAEILDDEASRAVWPAIRDARPLVGAGAAVWRVSVRPSAGPAVVAALGDTGAAWFLDWGGGLVWIAGPADASLHDRIAASARAAGGTWTLMRAPDPLRRAVDVVPPEPAPLARITREVKAAFDPRGVLNPGRMFASL